MVQGPAERAVLLRQDQAMSLIEMKKEDKTIIDKMHSHSYPLSLSLLILFFRSCRYFSLCSLLHYLFTSYFWNSLFWDYCAVNGIAMSSYVTP